jgi:hypothetical protein
MNQRKIKLDNVFYFVIGGFIILGVLAIFATPIESAIPPTPAFRSINGTGGNVTATNYMDNLELIEGSNISYIWDYVGKTVTISSTGGSITSIHQIGNVTESGCGVNQILKVNSTGYFACASDNTGTGGEINTMSSPTHANSLVLTKSDVDLPIKGIACTGSAICTGNTTDLTIDVSGLGSGNATVLNQLGDVIITNPVNFSILFYNAGVWIDQIFKINTFDTTCSGTDKVSGVAIDNQTGLATITCSTDQTGSGGGITSLAANVTSALTGTGHTLLWTIPLTANSGNNIVGAIVATSNTAGSALQVGANTTNANSNGWCEWRTPLTASTQEFDYLLASTANVVDTGAGTWLPAANIPQPIQFDCTIVTNTTPGDLRIFIQAEVASTVSAKAGSYYIKTP